MKQHAWILAAGLVATGLQPAWAQEARTVRVTATPAGVMVGDTTAEAATLPASQRWRTWMGLSIRLLAKMTDARRDGDTAAFADLARAYAEAMRNVGQAAQSAGTGRDLALRQVEAAIGRHRAVLEGLLDRVPTTARVHIEQSIIAADNSQDLVMAALGGQGATIAAGTVDVTPDNPVAAAPAVVRPAGQAPVAGATDTTVVAPQDVEPTRPTADTTRRARRTGAAATTQPAAVAPAVVVPVVPGAATPVSPGFVGAPVVPGFAPVVPGVNTPLVPGVNAPVVPGVNVPLVPGVNTPVVPGVNAPLRGTPSVVPGVPFQNNPALRTFPNGTGPVIRGRFTPTLPGASPFGAPPIAPAPVGPGVAPGGRVR